MQSQRIMVWRFALAPEPLRAMWDAFGRPEWLALVPRSLCSPDLDREIRRQGVSRCETDEGDFVYAGMSPVDLALPAVLSTH